MNYELNDTKETIIKLLETNDIDRNKYLLKFLKIMKHNSSHQIFSLPPKYSTNLLKSNSASFLLAFKIANKIIIKTSAIITYSILITIIIIYY